MEDLKAKEWRLNHLDSDTKEFFWSDESKVDDFANQVTKSLRKSNYILEGANNVNKITNADLKEENEKLREGIKVALDDIKGKVFPSPARDNRIKQLEQLLKNKSIDDSLINAEWLHDKHPELSIQGAENLMIFCKDHTITHKECYGDGRIMYPKWRKNKTSK